MKNKENTLPVTIGEMILALRKFAEGETDYHRLILTETAAELEKVQEARKRAVRRAQYMTQPKKAKVCKVAPAERPPLLTKIVEAGETDKCCACGYKFHSERVSELPSCNDCGKKRTCEHVPRLGAYTRINCPLWEKE